MKSLPIEQITLPNHWIIIKILYAVQTGKIVISDSD